MTDQNVDYSKAMNLMAVPTLTYYLGSNDDSGKAELAAVLETNWDHLSHDIQQTLVRNIMSVAGYQPEEPEPYGIWTKVVYRLLPPGNSDS